jgi:hypothetical protein
VVICFAGPDSESPCLKLEFELIGAALLPLPVIERAALEKASMLLMRAANETSSRLEQIMQLCKGPRPEDG